MSEAGRESKTPSNGDAPRSRDTPRDRDAARNDDTPRNDDLPAVAVVGAGAVGTTAAHDLAAAGADVTVFERDRVAGAASGRAAGVLYDAFAHPVDARVADRAMERFRALDGRGDFSFTETPYVWLAREGDDRRAAAIREQVSRMCEHGRDAELVAPEALRAEFPALRTDDVAVAAVARGGGRTEPHTYAELLASMAEAEGATVRTGVEAAVRTDPPRVLADGEQEDFDAMEEDFDAVLVAAGARTKQVLADAGIAVPLKPYRVQALTTAAVAPSVPMLYDATGGFYLRPRDGGILAGDGTEPVEADPDDWDPAGDDWFVEEMTSGLAHRIPSLDADLPVTEAWAGLCVATPDRDPLLGPVAEGLFVAAGWQGHGFMRAPALGEAAADAVLDGVRPDSVDRASGGDRIPEFDPGRFDGDEEFEVVEGMAVDVE